MDWEPEVSRRGTVKSKHLQGKESGWWLSRSWEIQVHMCQSYLGFQATGTPRDMAPGPDGRCASTRALIQWGGGGTERS